MKWIQDLSIMNKLRLGFGLCFIFMVGLGIFSIYQLSQVKETISEIQDHWLKTHNSISAMKIGLNELRNYELQYALSTEKTELENYQKKINQKGDTLKEAIKKFNDVKLSDYEKKLLDDLKTDLSAKYNAYLSDHDNALSLINQNKSDDAKTLIHVKMQQEYDDFYNGLINLSNKHKESLKDAAKAADDLFIASLKLIIGLMAIFLITAAYLSWLLSRSISLRLIAAVKIADQLSEGSLPEQVIDGSTDEVGKVLTAMNKMVEYLKNISQVANAIAGGDLSSELAPRSSRDIFGNTFKNMTLNLRNMAGVAQTISSGDLTAQVEPQSDRDAFGKSFKMMVENLREMAGVANTIAKGDLFVRVEPRSNQDLFGNSLKMMVENLRVTATVADSIAKGDLNVKFEAQSSADVFGITFKKMLEKLRYFADVTDKIATGDLSIKVEPQSSADLFGQSFKKMFDSLRAIVKELREGVESLSSAASELAALASQQTSTISAQASSIQQISTTLEQIRAIIEQASDRAHSVVKVADQSLEISESGQQELNQVVDAMGKIKDQVESIAENILDLSEKTIQIGEITSSVNDIAEQSNLLAVNAAIEATKAGEAGKGFGVVAVEVKNLASRSKKATSQVKSILAEIQKAANSTVMVTEEGSKRVEAGVGQVQRIGSSIKSLHKVIVESSNAARQIASATNQQVTGIEQIAMAMKTINQGAFESVSGAKQQKMTAQNLSQLAYNLNGLVQRYRLN